MGLIDRDYMHEGRPRPFTPPPEKLGWLSKVFIFTVVLFLLYKIADWKLSQEAAKRVIALPPETQEPVERPAAPAAPSFPPAPSYSGTESIDNTRTITKCLVNGKTSYSDAGCAAGAKVTRIVTKENHNLMAAVRVPLVNTSGEPEPTPSVFPQRDQSFDQSAMKAECLALEEHVKYLDALARQPQSGPMQDLIREDRKKARDRQARIPCR